MAKSKKDKTSKKVTAKENWIDKIPDHYRLIGSLIFILGSVLVFFAPTIFGDKIFTSGDILTRQAYNNFFDKGGQLLWDPYIFCGMPLFGNPGWFDFFGQIVITIRDIYSSMLANDQMAYSIYLALLGFGSFFLMRHLKANILVSLLVAVATIFSIGIASLVYIGHMTKLSTLSAFPFIILLLLRIKERIKLIDIALLLLALKFMFSQWHLQIIFYTYFVIGTFFIYYFIRSVIIKDNAKIIHLLKTGGMVLALSILAFSMHYSRLGQIREYAPFSTRGTKSILDTQQASTKQSEDKFYKYSTDWSFSPGEVMTFFVPSYYGSGKSIYKGPLTNNQEYQINTYFGQMPFVDAPQYMGIIILLLALYGIYVRWKDPLVQFITLLIGVSLLLSFGRNFPVLYDLFYSYVPYFKTFRAPVMILNIVQIFIPLLAGLGIMEIISLKDKNDEKKINLFKNAGLLFAALFLVSLIFKSVFADWFVERIIDSGSKGRQLQPLYEYMSDMFITDLNIVLIFASAAMLFIFAFLKRQVRLGIVLAVLIAITMFDLWRIHFRVMSYEDADVLNNRFVKPDYVRVIESQNDKEPFRILNIKQDGSPGSLNNQSNFHVSFLIEDFYGYSALKPRSYQDFMDITGPANFTLWRMLNAKYLISEKPLDHPALEPIFSNSKTTLSLNHAALPRAYFIDSVAFMPAMEFLSAVKNNEFDPKETAFVDEELSVSIDKPTDNAEVTITQYDVLNIKIDAEATGTNMLFLGNTFYSKGWKALVDGKPAEILKVNHGFMGLVLTEGRHQIEFYYSPDTYVTGKYIALVLNIGLLVLFAFIFVAAQKKKEE
ncbi:YfhO family protein [Bacteroidota bacterium]